MLAILVMCETVAAAPALPSGSPAATSAKSASPRLLTSGELAASAMRAKLRGADATQSFRVSFAPFILGADVLTSDGGVTIVDGDRVVTHPWSEGAALFGGVAGVAFWDLDGNGFSDVLAVADVCMGANCVENHWPQLVVLLNDGTALRSATSWAASVPIRVVERGAVAVRAHARAHRPSADTP